MIFRHLSIAILSGLLLASTTTVEASNAKLSDEQIAFFEKEIRPVLVRECYGCHSNKSGRARGGLLLDTKAASLQGGFSGPAVVPGNLEESLLWTSINYESYEMPPSGKMPTATIAKFKKWIEMGAPDPRAPQMRKLDSTITAHDIKRAKQEFWAYQKLETHSPPAVSEQYWAHSAIDRFVLAELEAAGMQPATDADPHTILKRLTFDLIGLPPTPEQIAWFVERWEDDPNAAIERVVDRLLASEHFGERWGRHWLDVARYAESTGKEINLTFPYAWRYRDYVIDSFNEDKPFDRFLMEQIAGDLMPVKTDEQWSENLVATTFLAVGPKAVSEQSRAQFSADLVDEQIDVTTRVFLGTSVSCARCHDHKFDPIPQTDYYAMVGIFQNMTTYYGTIGANRNRQSSEVLLLPKFDQESVAKPMDAMEVAALKRRLRELEEQEIAARRIRRRVIFNGETGPGLPDKDDPILDIRTIAQLGRQVAEVKAKLATVDPDGKPVGKCMGVQENGTVRDATLYIRGELDQPAQTVRRGIPQVLANRPLKISNRSSGRLELARWMASEENPLTARVMANRIWKHLLGEGIVSSTENFGSTGQPPSHPELLDYLANRFVDTGWSVKSLIREIVTSRTYRLASTYNSNYFEIDPENRLLWRATPRRLDAESIRDAMLYISGELELQRPTASLIARVGDGTINGGQVAAASQLGSDESRAGSSTERPDMRRRPRNMFVDDNGMIGGFGRGRGNFVSLDVAHENYRSVFMPIVRDFTPRSLEVFDFPDASMVVGDRYESNTSNQALFMLNNPLVIRTSKALANKLLDEHADPEEQVKSAFLQIYSRPGTEAELSATQDFIRQRRNIGGRIRIVETLAQICQALFASAEFRYRY